MSERSGRLLVVDGSASQRKKLAHILEHAGFAVSAAADGAAALVMALASPPDAILSTVVLPDLSGYDLCRKLKSQAETLHVPFLLVTAVTDPSAILEALACGADCFIPKPYDAALLVWRLGHLLATPNPDATAVDEGDAIELYFLGETVRVTAGKWRMGNLVASALEQSAALNQELVRSQGELAIAKAKVDEYAMRLEGRVEEGERRFGAFMENIPAGTFGRNEEGRLVYANRQLLRFVGEDAEQADVPLHVRLASFDKAALEQDRSALADGGSAEFELKLRSEDGTSRDLLVIEFPILGAPGTAVGGIALDVTEQKLLEEQFRQSHKMEAIGQLAGGVAHDFNNILAVITSYTSLLMPELAPGSQMHEDIDQIERAALRAAGLTRQLLAFSRRQVLQPTFVDLSAVVRDLESMLRRTVSEDILLVLEVEPVESVLVDAVQMEQVLLNLVLNARDAMPKGGVITIRTGNATFSGARASAHRGAIPVAYVTLSVTDTGTGMDAATQARIFEPFYTTKTIDKGTGLGLATVYGIVQQSRGEITVTSAPNEGSTFTIRFPRVDATSSSTPERRPISDVPCGETILLVEDDSALRAACGRILRSAGYEVLEAEDAMRACTLAEAYGGHIDVLLTDVVMPRKSGTALAIELQRLRPNMNVLFMSGYADGRLDQQGVPSDAHFLEKPFTPPALRRKLREAIGTKRKVT